MSDMEIAEELHELSPDSSDFRREVQKLRQIQNEVLEQTRRTLTNVRALVDG